MANHLIYLLYFLSPLPSSHLVRFSKNTSNLIRIDRNLALEKKKVPRVARNGPMTPSAGVFPQKQLSTVEATSSSQVAGVDPAKPLPLSGQMSSAFGSFGLLMILWVLPAKNVILMMPFCLQDLPLARAGRAEQESCSKSIETHGRKSLSCLAAVWGPAAATRCKYAKRGNTDTRIRKILSYRYRYKIQKIQIQIRRYATTAAEKFTAFFHWRRKSVIAEYKNSQLYCM